MRQYLPTLAELVDRLSIVMLKITFKPDHPSLGALPAQQYIDEAKLIMHDINELLANKGIAADIIASCLGLMLANQYIWNVETEVRQGNGANDHLLRITHSVNAVRAYFKNFVSAAIGERQDFKVGCLGAEMPKDGGNWEALAAILDVQEST